jgi:nitroreductase
MAEMGLFEAIYSARALRRFKPDPVPDEVLTKVLEAATRAPSGSNAQNWIFGVIKDAELRRKLGDIYRKGAQILTAFYADRPRPAHVTETQYNRMLASATYLFEHMHEAPVLLLACLRGEGVVSAGAAGAAPEVRSAMARMARVSGSSIYPAVQNVILACRAFGLGTVLTTVHLFHEDEVKALLGLPEDVHSYALMPIGYPRDKFGPVRRRPVGEVAFLDRWGNHWRG